MYFRTRRRHGSYPLAQEHALPGWARMVLAAGAILFAAYLLWTLLLRLLGIGSAIERVGAMLTVEDRGSVNVVIDGTSQRAESGLQVFPGESVTTGLGAHAALQFFDGSRMRMEENSEVGITENGRGDPSQITLDLRQGSMWVKTADRSSFSGSVLRTVTSPTLSFTLGNGAEAELSPTSLAVFAAEAEGIEVTLGRRRLMISEGQQWTMPASGTLGVNVYETRTPLDPVTARSVFVLESRRRAVGSSTTPIVSRGSDILSVTSPLDGASMRETVITVQGTVSPAVAHVMIDGHPAVLDTEKGTFSQQVSPAAGEGDVELHIQALDTERNVLSELRRMVHRSPVPPLPAPVITSPARADQIYQTEKVEIVLRGNAPLGTANIFVNDYKLQLFDPARGEWSYIASMRLGNMIAGTNIYDVYALDGAGRKSSPARITIIQGQGSEGVVTGTASSAPAGPLPSNAPLLPGTLTVTSPTPGTSHAGTGTGYLIEGTTSAQTATVSVNDYTLQLYRAGRTNWNYLAEVGLNNLKPGKNTYVIVARNAKGEILDRLEYVIELTNP